MSRNGRSHFRVGPDEAGKTVQRVLHDRTGLSHAAVKGLVADGAVRRNGATVSSAADRVERDDRIEAEWEPGRSYRAPRRVRSIPGCRIVHEDDALVVVDKSPGLPTVPVSPADADSVRERLLHSYRSRGHRRPFVREAHRIDRYTSGIVAFARSPAALSELRKQFRRRTPERLYLALVEGRPEPDRARLRHRLVEDPKSLKVRAVAVGGSLALCDYRVVEAYDHASLVEVRLITGRRNQIRVQFASEGHPVIGDTAYGTHSPRIERVALHAARLVLSHPDDGRTMAFSCAPHDDFARLQRALHAGGRP